MSYRAASFNSTRRPRGSRDNGRNQAWIDQSGRGVRFYLNCRGRQMLSDARGRHAAVARRAAGKRIGSQLILTDPVRTWTTGHVERGATRGSAQWSQRRHCGSEPRPAYKVDRWDSRGRGGLYEFQRLFKLEIN